MVILMLVGDHFVDDVVGREVAWVVGWPAVHLFVAGVAHEEVEVMDLGWGDLVVTELDEFWCRFIGLISGGEEVADVFFYWIRKLGSRDRMDRSSRRRIGRLGGR